ncbi:MAG: hypothetical protein R2685_11020 [Candidatus Nitrosocosmicus sp.]|nr:hypothetical protein [Candidatus Nitrosocosmicus sp.]
MQQRDLSNLKIRMDAPVISSITVYNQPHVYLSYSDSDSMTDYFNGRSTGVNHAIELLKTDGAEIVQVHTNYSEYCDPEGVELEKLLRRIKKMADKAGYINNVTMKREHNEMDGVRQEWLDISGTFIRKPEHIEYKKGGN